MKYTFMEPKTYRDFSPMYVVRVQKISIHIVKTNLYENEKNYESTAFGVDNILFFFNGSR